MAVVSVVAAIRKLSRRDHRDLATSVPPLDPADSVVAEHLGGEGSAAEGQVLEADSEAVIAAASAEAVGMVDAAALGTNPTESAARHLLRALHLVLAAAAAVAAGVEALVDTVAVMEGQMARTATVAPATAHLTETGALA